MSASIRFWCTLLLAGLFILGACSTPDDGADGGNDAAPTDGNGVVVLESAYSMDSTYARVKRALEANDQISIVAQLDHAANAERVDLSLRPTRVLMFGNPAMGTPLMQSSQTTGIDLPQKVLVYEDADGTVHLAYNDPQYLAERHDIADREEELQTASKALRKLARHATGK
ncbi:DUF302 domain-containing protein [Salinibacter altiplanensis]|uniref:DUF302 domain-containing protein n=1 Tax=Salinibacter altiplanensis TaxID=1803181 RepID=UPI000C9F5B91|nr:DUF302 domain-containing protein [Salinibacter altiplanensis]